MCGCEMFKVVKKLKGLKRKLRQLNGQHFRNIISEAEEDRATLPLIQSEMHNNPNNVELQQKERELHQKFRRSSYLAEIFLQQRSKVSWIKLGDDNTRYFFSVIKHRRLQQAITQLKYNQYKLQTEQDEITKVFVE